MSWTDVALHGVVAAVLRVHRLAGTPVIPMIMNREAFFVASVLIAFFLGGIFGYIRGRRQ